MKKIIGLTVAALMVMGLVGGGTWAYFSDTETVGSNILTGGTLDLGLGTTSGGTGSISGTFSAADFAPGDTITDVIYVNNDGSIDMTSVNITFSHEAVLDGTPGTISPLPGGNTDDLDKMLIATTVSWNGSAVSALDGESLATLAALGSYNLGALPANTEVEFEILWTFDPTATNGCQGDSVNMTMTFLGKQQ